MELPSVNDLWQEQPETLKTLSFDGRTFAGTTINEEIYLATIDGFDNKWRKIPGSLKQIVVLGNALYGVNKDEKVCFGRAFGDPAWQEIGSRARWVSTDGTQIVVSNTSGDEVWISETGSGSVSFHQVLGKKVRQCVVWGGHLYAVDAENQLWHGNSRGEPNWTLIPTEFKQVAFDGKTLVGLTPEGVVLYAQHDLQSTPQWIEWDSGCKHVEVNAGQVWVLKR